MLIGKFHHHLIRYPSRGRARRTPIMDSSRAVALFCFAAAARFHSISASIVIFNEGLQTPSGLLGEFWVFFYQFCENWRFWPVDVQLLRIITRTWPRGIQYFLVGFQLLSKPAYVVLMDAMLGSGIHERDSRLVIVIVIEVTWWKNKIKVHCYSNLS